MNDQTSDACAGQGVDQFLSTFGKQAGGAAKCLSVGKNGIVGFNGISGSAFAAKFGLMGRATNYLVSNRAATFTMMPGRSSQTEAHRGGFVDVYNRPPGGSFGVDPSRFPNNKYYFGLTMTATEALVHEIGHAVSALIPGTAAAAQMSAANTLLLRANRDLEGYATAFENVWRRTVLGETSMRSGYFSDGDIGYIPMSEIFP